MEYQLTAVGQLEITSEVHIAFHILRIGQIEECVLSLVVGMKFEDARCQSQQVSRCLGFGFDGYNAIIVGITETYLHDEQVLVVVAQNSVARGRIRQILVVERFANPRHGNVVQIQQVYLIAVVMALVVPLIAPT